MRNKMQSMSLITLTYLSDDALSDVINGNNYDEETKVLARRVLNSRKC